MASPITSSEALDADHGHTSAPTTVADWSSWRKRQWEVLRSCCAVRHPSSNAVMSEDASATTLVDVIASDLIQVSDLFKEATKLRSLFSSLKEWELAESRKPERALTLLTDLVSAHPLSGSDGTFGRTSPIVCPASPLNRIEQLPTPPQSSESESPSRSSLGAGMSFNSRRSDRSSRSKGSSNESKNRSGSSYTTAREPHRSQAYHTARGPSPTHSHVTHKTSRSSGTASSGGTATQSGAERETAEAVRAERAAKEKIRRRDMAMRVSKEGHRSRTIFEKKQKDAVDLDRKETRGGSTASAGSWSASTYGGGSVRSRTTASPAHERWNPMDVTGEMDDAYMAAWAKYLREWDGILRQPVGTASSPSRTFRTIPWPTLHVPTEPRDLSKHAIKAFFKFASHHGLSPRTPKSRRSVAVATDSAEETMNLIQVIQDGQMIWHPDKWSDWMRHVVEAEHDVVKKGADVVIRVLHRMNEQRKDKRDGSDGGL